MRLALLLLAALAAAPAAAQSCPGDCNGDGQVRVEEMIVGVRIALGEAALGDCPAFDASGDGELSINELVLAVANLLAGCPATPEPTATDPAPATPTVPTPTAPTPTAPTPTVADTPAAPATPTATPTIPPVSGTWIEAPLVVGDSTCAEPLTAAFVEELAGRGPCAQAVEQTGETSARVTDCSQQVVDGTLDRDGTIRLTFPPSESSVANCTLTLRISSVIAAGAAPVTADYAFALSFGGDACPLDDCAIDATATWTRAE
ncbi:hypothetical protein KF840_09540 [bacterium]|nr:hypothetical protein [bacterium]